MFLFYKIVVFIFFTSFGFFANAEDLMDTKNNFLNTLNKKESFLTLDILGGLEINPYGGAGYAFSVANYKSNAANYGGAVPQIFNDAYMVVGANIGSNLLFEIAGMTGGTSYTNGGSADLNAIHFNVGWRFGEELLGEYGDKNKFIVLAGLVLGITNVSVGGVSVAHNYVSVAPELGLAYQRYITDNFSIRLDARMSSLKVYDSNGSVMGTFVGMVLFHL